MCESTAVRLPVSAPFNSVPQISTERKQAHIEQLEDDITEFAAHIDAATTTGWCTKADSD